MSLLNRYGEMPLPEEKTQIRLVENPVEVAKAAYSLLLPVAERCEFNAAYFYTKAMADVVYDEAVRLLQPHAKAFGSVNSGELEEIIAATIHDEASGLFLSALLNKTDLPMLHGVFPAYSRGNGLSLFGYKLAPNKVLVVGEGSSCKSVGDSAAGGVIVFHGMADYLGREAAGGFIANFGAAREMATHAGGRSIQVNFAKMDGSVVDYGVLFSHPYFNPQNMLFAQGVSGGFYANLGITNYFGLGASGGLLLNCGQVESYSIDYGLRVSYNRAAGDLVVNKLNVKQIDDSAANPMEALNDEIDDFVEGGASAARVLRLWDATSGRMPLEVAVDRMERRLRTVERLCKGKGDVVEAIRNYDWLRFEGEIAVMARKIEALAADVLRSRSR